MYDDAHSYGAHADCDRSAGPVLTTTADETVPDDRPSSSVGSANAASATATSHETVEDAR